MIHQISKKVQTQIEMDQLTGTIAIQLRASIITLEESKKRLSLARAAMIAGCLNPLTCPAFMNAYQLQEKVEKGIQKIAEGNWEIQRIKWLRFQPFLSSKNNLSTIDECESELEMKIKIKLGSLTSTSLLKKTKGTQSHGWKIAWIE